MDEEQINIEDLQREFYKNLAWYFSKKETPTGLYNTIGAIKEQLIALNANLKDSSDSSDRLAVALNRLTLWGLIVAGSGVMIALGHLVFEIYKFFKCN